MKDSRRDTLKHISTVRAFLSMFIEALEKRAEGHDASKLEEPEKSIFDEYSSRLEELTYGSDEYNEALEGMKVALDHHYAENRHHPEHFEDGIRGMHLIDLLEMFVDWKAATMRHADGDIRESIEKNADRFGYGEDLEAIFQNTADWIEDG